MSGHEGIVDHYERLLAQHGSTARGADYRDDASQQVRFRRFDRLVLGTQSVCDLGCGYGAYLDHLRAEGYDGEYAGVDITPGMIERARADHPGARFDVGTEPTPAEAVVASGIFNVRFGDDEAWTAMVRRTIDAMWSVATVGIAFNLLSAATSPHLFTVSPEALGAWLADLGSPHTVMEHDVGTNEMTVIARH